MLARAGWRAPLLALLALCAGDASLRSAAAPARSSAGPAAPAAQPAGAGREGFSLEQNFARNRSAYIPAQCFTRVLDSEQSRPQNPCYICHAGALEPNQQSQPELQLRYDFPEPRAGREADNPWQNLFVDRSAALASISDPAVLRYVAQDNYGAAQPQSALAQRLVQLPPAWDRDHDGRWGGYLPDAYFHFDAAGFDVGPDGKPSGWRAFSYYPLPGAFLPTNGSFDDVLIRLPEAFREDASGAPDQTVYELNLALLEALIQRRDIAIEPTDERVVGADLDGDGVRGQARRVAFDFRPGQPSPMRYLGLAGQLQAEGRVQLAPGLFPEGTEFLHSVRYLALGPGGTPRPAPRFKELRYARKHHFLTYSQLIDRAQREAKEQALNPDRPELFLGDAEHGLSTGLGWVYQGFIEDAEGELRPQTYEETLYCMGCHSGLSATDDGVFTFSRKLDSGRARGYGEMGAFTSDELAWPDPLRQDGLPEYATYLRHNGGGDEYRSNSEVRDKFFDALGAERPGAFAALAQDIRTLLLPSPARALALDKAYWLLVREQSFAAGRNALLEPARTVLRSVASGHPTGVQQPLPAARLAATSRAETREPALTQAQRR